jgi:3-deoxy-D-manno-octulosonic-acid transferase
LKTLLYLLYSALGHGLYAILVLALPLTRFVGGRYGYEADQRLGRYPGRVAVRRSGFLTLWIHASSVGETQAALILIDALRASGESFRFILTSTTEQGHRMARTRLADTAICLMAPLDVRPAVRRAIRSLRPDLYIGLETELWPMLLAQLGNAHVPLLLLNGRLSERSHGRYLRVRSFMRTFLAKFEEVAVITEADGRRFADLGVPVNRIQVCGNLKYDMPAEQTEQTRVAQRRRLGVTDQKIFVCGSTHEGEEELLLPVFRQLAATFAVIWVVAPRHLERLPAVESFFRRAGLAVDRYSELARKGRTAPVVLVDTMGDLADLYCGGDYLFCGGSLVNRGGHNIMEAARWGRPVCFGPSMKDFRDAADLLRTGGGGFEVADAAELTVLLLHHHAHPEAYLAACARAADIAASQRGAVARQVAIVRRHLDRRRKSTPPGEFRA